MSKKSTLPTDAKPAKPVIVFGLDEHDKPRAAVFAAEQTKLALKAAELMKLKALQVEGYELTALAAVLSPGRIYSSGHGFVPSVQQRFYDQLDEIANRKSPPGLPKSFDEIKPGDLIIAEDDGLLGWWEAIVLAREGDMLKLRWRDFPKQAQVSRHVSAVALLNPQPVT
jgi:hypothetical protein